MSRKTFIAKQPIDKGQIVTTEHVRPVVIDEPPEVIKVPDLPPALTTEIIDAVKADQPTVVPKGIEPPLANPVGYLERIGLTPDKYEAFATIFAWSRGHTHEGPMPCACPSCAFVREYAGPLLGG